MAATIAADPLAATATVGALWATEGFRISKANVYVVPFWRVRLECTESVRVPDDQAPRD